MLGNALAWVCLAVFVTPGWFAVRGWYVGRREPSSQPLADWLPLGLAISLAWSGVVALSGGAAEAATLVVGGSSPIRIGAWLILLTVLWLVPFGAGWALGLRTRTRGRHWVTTLVLRSGTTITGTIHHETAIEFVLADITLDERRYDRLTVNRSDVKLLLCSRCDTAMVDPAQGSNSEQLQPPRGSQVPSPGARSAC